MKKYIVFALLLLLPFIVNADFQRYKFNNWIVTIDNEQKYSMLHGIDKSDTEVKYPQLLLWCANAWRDKKEYKMGLLSNGVIDVENPDSIDVMISVDNNPKFNDGWYEEQHILFTPISRVHIKSMLNGNELHVQLRDKHKLHKYTYPLADFEEALQLMSQVCMYQFE